MVGKRDGCLARQANRARTDVLRRAMRQGKEKFDRIVSKRAAKLDEKGADYRKERRTLKKMDVTRWFIRPSEKKKSEGVAATSSSMMVASGSSAALSSSYTATSCSTSASWNSSSSWSRSAGSSSSSAGGSNNTESVKYYCLFVFLLFGQQRLCLTLCVWLLLLFISKMSREELLKMYRVQQGIIADLEAQGNWLKGTGFGEMRVRAEADARNRGEVMRQAAARLRGDVGDDDGGGKRPADVSNKSKKKQSNKKSHVADFAGDESNKESDVAVVVGGGDDLALEGDADGGGLRTPTKENGDKEKRGGGKKTPKKRKSLEKKKKKNRTKETWVDEDGDLESVLQFFWPDKEVLVKWEKSGEKREPATCVIEDMPEETLSVVWRDWKGNLDVVEWVNGLTEVRKAVPGWRDIESYALERQWEGAYKVPMAAEGGVEKQSPVVDGKRDGLGNLVKKRKTTRVPAAPARVSVGSEVVVCLPVGEGLSGSSGLPSNIVCASVDGSVGVSTIGKGEAGGGEDRGEPGMDDPDWDDGPNVIKDVCKPYAHEWEECDKPSYVEYVLWRRTCFICARKFVPGKQEEGEDDSGRYWLSGRTKVSHCTKCKVAVCQSHGCLVKLCDVERERTPRKAKRERVN